MNEKIKITFRLAEHGFYVNDVLYEAPLMKCNNVNNIVENVKTVLIHYFKQKFEVTYSSITDASADAKGNAIYLLSTGRTQLEYSYDGCTRVNGIIAYGGCRKTCSQLKIIDEKSFKSTITDLLIKISYQFQKKEK